MPGNLWRSMLAHFKINRSKVVSLHRQRCDNLLAVTFADYLHVNSHSHHRYGAWIGIGVEG